MARASSSTAGKATSSIFRPTCQPKFWSVPVYDSLSRSELKNGQPFPSVSKYGDPKVSADGVVDIYFGPQIGRPGEELDQDRCRQGLVPDLPPLRPASAALRQVLGAERHRASEPIKDTAARALAGSSNAARTAPAHARRSDPLRTPHGVPMRFDELMQQ